MVMKRHYWVSFNASSYLIRILLFYREKTKELHTLSKKRINISLSLKLFFSTFLRTQVFLLKNRQVPYMHALIERNLAREVVFNSRKGPGVCVMCVYNYKVASFKCIQEQGNGASNFMFLWKLCKGKVR